MSELRSPEPTQDVKRWRVIIEGGVYSRYVDLAVSGRELLMNRSPEQFRQLLGERFDKAVEQLRAEFLADA